MRIIFCGISGLPNKTSAAANRYLAIAQAMSINNEIILINRIPKYNKGDIKVEYETGLLTIIEATQIKYRLQSFYKRNLLKLASYFYEFKTIKKLNKEKQIDFMNVYSQYFKICLFYYLIAKLLKIKTIFHYVEFRSEIANRNIFYRLNDYLLDNYAIHLFDKHIPISTYLNNHILQLKSNAKTIIVPPLCDFNYFDHVKAEQNNTKYIVYCGSANYDEVILVILKSFLKLTDQFNVHLHLVINGTIKNSTINELIKNNPQRIILYTKLDYKVLIAKYKGALALLIPIRNTIQDKARFPQKICEYLASKRPIITTSFGEINSYFFDSENALIANEFSVDSFSNKLEWALNNQDKLESIAQKSYLLGYEKFNIHSYSSPLNKFMRS